MKRQKCPICGKEFEPRVNQKYCSPVCRDEGERRKRQEWYERTDYLERQRKKRQQAALEREQKEVEQINERQRTRALEMQKRIEAEKKAAEKELKKKAKAGDYKALMELSENDLDYWKYYALADIEESEKKYGRKSTREVNGISVYAPDFAKRVVDSIEKTGRCFSRSHGLGEKLPT